MRQVPHYLIIGQGRVARHVRQYFSLIPLHHDIWHRGQPVSALQSLAQKATHILLLINDDAIETFINEHLVETKAVKIHFSGALVTPLAYGAHPLMTFGEELYDLPVYQAMPFVIDDDAPDFQTLLPGISNPHARLPKTQKAKYHALCVMAGNFSCLLWQKLFSALEQEFHIPPSFARGYLRRQTKNILHDYHTALTGPLARGDQATIDRNIKALEGDPFQSVYKSFVEAYKP